MLALDLSWAVCRYEGVIGTVPGVVAPLLAALFIQHFGRRAGIMLGCVMIIVGLVSNCADLKTGAR
jgi:hypothetical protein